MRKTKTIEVASCDFCINEDRETWRCVHCDKDACSNCGNNWDIQAEQPQAVGTFRTSSYLFGGPSPVRYSAFICSDCSEGVLAALLVAFGFADRKLQHREAS